MIRHTMTCVILAATSLVAPSLASAEVGANQSTNSVASASNEKAVEYNILELPVVEFFETLQWDTGQRIIVGTEISGVLRNEDLSGTAAEIVNQVTAEHGLDWFAYDGIIHISRADDDITKFIPLEGYSAERAITSLGESGLSSEFGVFKPVAEGAAISISGPPEFVAIAEAILELTQANPEHAAVRVRRGTDATVEYYGSSGLVAAKQSPQAPTHSFLQVQTAPAPSGQTNTSN